MKLTIVVYYSITKAALKGGVVRVRNCHKFYMEEILS